MNLSPKSQRHTSRLNHTGRSGTRQGLFRKSALALAIAAASAAAIAATAPHLAQDVSSPARSTQIPTQGPLPASFADLVAAVRPAVVNVSVSTEVERSASGQTRSGPRGLPENLPIPEPFRRFFEFPGNGRQAPESGPRQGVGSGFVVDPDGWVVTNHHVVEHATEITVTLHDGKKYIARHVGSDPKTDLALLRIEAEEALPFVPFGDSDATRVGDWVLAVGNPFGLGGTVTAGIVSARGRDIGSGPYDDFIQIDAPINRGNSGGPLFNSKGEVVGINTAIFSPTGGSVGIGFAIPASLAKPLIADLRDDGEVDRGWLGVSIQPVDDGLARGLGLDEARGALVTRVMPDTPASKAGVSAGDIVVEYAGHTVDSVKDLTRAVADTKAGTTTTIVVLRDGKATTLKAAISAYPRDDKTRLAASSPAATDGPRLGLSVAPATKGGHSGSGLVVTEVEPSGPAAKQGLRPGDVLLRAGSRSLSSAADLVDSVKKAAGDDLPVVLLVKRDDSQRFVAVEPESSRG